MVDLELPVLGTKQHASLQFLSIQTLGQTAQLHKPAFDFICTKTNKAREFSKQQVGLISVICIPKCLKFKISQVLVTCRKSKLLSQFLFLRVTELKGLTNKKWKVYTRIPQPPKLPYVWTLLFFTLWLSKLVNLPYIVLLPKVWVILPHVAVSICQKDILSHKTWFAKL